MKSELTKLVSVSLLLFLLLLPGNSLAQERRHSYESIKSVFDSLRSIKFEKYTQRFIDFAAATENDPCDIILLSKDSFKAKDISISVNTILGLYANIVSFNDYYFTNVHNVVSFANKSQKAEVSEILNSRFSSIEEYIQSELKDYVGQSNLLISQMVLHEKHFTDRPYLANVVSEFRRDLERYVSILRRHID